MSDSTAGGAIVLIALAGFEVHQCSRTDELHNQLNEAHSEISDLKGKVFGVGLSWLLSPLKLLMSPLGKLGGMLWRALGLAAFKIFLRFGTVIRAALFRIGPMILELAPAIGEAIMGAFALVSNPLGWTVLAVLATSAAIAFALTYKKEIGAWIGKTWGSIKQTFFALDWAAIGKGIAWAIADGMTFGLASRLLALASAAMGLFHGSGGTAPAPRSAGTFRFDRQARTPPLLAGKGALGGPVRGGRMYLVGEHGPELFQAPMSGSITTASRTAAMMREAARRRRIEPMAPRDRRGRGTVRAGGDTYNFTINGVSDPEQVDRVVEMKLRRMAGQDALS